MNAVLQMFRHETQFESFAAGQKIFSKGEAGEVMYVVFEGEVELRIDGGLVESLEPGAPFGEMALIDFAARTATAIAKTDCKLIAIPEKRFLKLVEQTPYFSLQIMKAMAERLRKMNTQR